MEEMFAGEDSEFFAWLVVADADGAAGLLAFEQVEVRPKGDRREAVEVSLRRAFPARLGSQRVSAWCLTCLQISLSMVHVLRSWVPRVILSNNRGHLSSSLESSRDRPESTGGPSFVLDSTRLSW